MLKQNLIEDLFAWFEIDNGRFYKSEETWKEFYKTELLKAFQYGAYWQSTGQIKYEGPSSVEKKFERYFDLFHNTKLNEDEFEG
jgi:hypothetical protein